MTKDSTSAEITIPNEELTVRFAVLMRRFLSPVDRLYYRDVWVLLKDQFGELFSEEQIAQIEHSIERLTSGFGRVNYNGEDLTAERVYQIIAEGQYFNREEEYQEYFKGWANVPVIGPFLWHRFYTYIEEGLGLASQLFDLIQIAEKSEEYKRLYGEPANITNRCIYCLSTTGTFMSEEHSVPESLGNYDSVLPRGYVCDACNHGVLSTLDTELGESMLFTYQRVTFVPYTKRGKLPEERFQGATLKKTSPMDVAFIADKNSKAVRVIREREDGLTELAVNIRGRKKLNEKLLARALCKVGLGLVALDHGQEYACSNRYDKVRAFIKDGVSFRNYLLIRTEFAMQPDIRIRYVTLPEGTPFVFHIFGVTLLVNLEEKPVMDVENTRLRDHFHSFPLFGTLAWQNFEMHMVSDPSSLDTLYDDFLADFERVMYADPNDAEALANRGVIYYQMGLYEDSLHDLNRSLELRSDDPDTLANRGNTFSAMGNNAKALEDYTRSLEIRPNDPIALKNRGLAYGQMERYPEALDDYNLSLTIRPNHLGTMVDRATIYQLMGRHEDAEAEYTRVLELLFNEPPTMKTLDIGPITLINRGNIRCQAGQYTEALSDYDQALEMLSTQPDTTRTLEIRRDLLFNKAFTYYRLERYEEAAVEYSNILIEWPDEPSALGNRGLAYVHLGLLEEANIDLARMRELDPDSHSTFYNMACFYSLCQDNSAALSSLAEAIKRHPSHREQAQTDQDFTGLRSNAEFLSMIA